MNSRLQNLKSVVQFDAFGCFEIVDPKILEQVSGAGMLPTPDWCIGSRCCNTNSHVKCTSSGAAGIALPAY